MANVALVINLNVPPGPFFVICEVRSNFVFAFNRWVVIFDWRFIQMDFDFLPLADVGANA